VKWSLSLREREAEIASGMTTPVAAIYNGPIASTNTMPRLSKSGGAGAKSVQVTLMSDSVTACPECDAVDIQPRDNGPRGFNADGDWRCRDCETIFDEPARRATDHPYGRHGLAKELAESQR
jgi:hypothetical protein